MAFDRNKFKDEIKKALQGVEREKQVAFAVRCAMRVLPLLAIENKGLKFWQKPEAFWFWKKEDRTKHLLAIVKAYNATIRYALTKKYAAYAAAAAAVDVDVDVIIQEIKTDLSALTQLNISEFLFRPLWSHTAPKAFSDLQQKFIKDASSLKAGFEVWLDWYQDRLDGKAIDVDLLEQWVNVPKEIEDQGIKAINGYLKSLANQNSSQPLNRVRAIFIGYGEAGKTSLIKALHNEDVEKGGTDMTCGIEIRDWEVPDTDIKAHLWDFGGQVMFHSTHKFFLRSSCVYIIVINARADINNSEQAEYWLEHVKAFGDSAPVLLVANKADEAQIHLQMENLTRKYPNIKGYYPVSCTHAKTTYQSQFQIFKQALTQELKNVGLHQVMFTNAQAALLAELRQNSLADAFLTANKFQQLCDKHGVSDEGELNRDWLVDIFDKLGVMLHFDELKIFHDAYMLNPRWLTHGVYTFINNKQARLSESEMAQILKQAKVEDEYQHLLQYPAEKCLFLSKAMQRFKLCYPLANGYNAMLIPALLEDELPNIDLLGFKNLEGLETLTFEFAFQGFLPRNLINEFMVSRHEEIKDDLQSQRGAVFKSKSLQAEALVEADYHRRLITMQVYGRDAKEYLAILYDTMLATFGDLKLDYTEMVYLPKSACLNNRDFVASERKKEKADYKQLLEWAKAGQIVYITRSGLRYDLAKVLNFILSKSEQQKIINNIYGDNSNLKQTAGDNMTRNIKTNNHVEGNVTGGNIAGRDINMGGSKVNNIENSTVNGSVVAAESIDNSFTQVQALNAEPEIKNLLTQLLSEIQNLNQKIPSSPIISDMQDDADALIEEISRENPRPKRCLDKLQYIGLFSLWRGIQNLPKII